MLKNLILGLNNILRLIAQTLFIILISGLTVYILLEQTYQPRIKELEKNILIQTNQEVTSSSKEEVTFLTEEVAAIKEEIQLLKQFKPTEITFVTDYETIDLITITSLLHIHEQLTQIKIDLLSENYGQAKQRLLRLEDNLPLSDIDLDNPFLLGLYVDLLTETISEEIYQFTLELQHQILEIQEQPMLD